MLKCDQYLQGNDFPNNFQEHKKKIKEYLGLDTRVQLKDDLIKNAPYCIQFIIKNYEILKSKSEQGKL